MCRVASWDRLKKERKKHCSVKKEDMTQSQSFVPLLRPLHHTVRVCVCMSCQCVHEGGKFLRQNVVIAKISHGFSAAML